MLTILAGRSKMCIHHPQLYTYVRNQGGKTTQYALLDYNFYLNLARILFFGMLDGRLDVVYFRAVCLFMFIKK